MGTWNPNLYDLKKKDAPADLTQPIGVLKTNEMARNTVAKPNPNQPALTPKTISPNADRIGMFGNKGGMSLDQGVKMASTVAMALDPHGFGGRMGKGLSEIADSNIADQKQRDLMDYQRNNQLTDRNDEWAHEGGLYDSRLKANNLREDTLHTQSRTETGQDYTRNRKDNLFDINSERGWLSAKQDQQNKWTLANREPKDPTRTDLARQMVSSGEITPEQYKSYVLGTAGGGNGITPAQTISGIGSLNELTKDGVNENNVTDVNFARKTIGMPPLVLKKGQEGEHNWFSPNVPEIPDTYVPQSGVSNPQDGSQYTPIPSDQSQLVIGVTYIDPNNGNVGTWTGKGLRPIQAPAQQTPPVQAPAAKIAAQVTPPAPVVSDLKQRLSELDRKKTNPMFVNPFNINLDTARKQAETRAAILDNVGKAGKAVNENVVRPAVGLAKTGFNAMQRTKELENLDADYGRGMTHEEYAKRYKAIMGEN